MTAIPNTVATTDQGLGLTTQPPAAVDFPEPARPVLRFGLRHVFWFVTAVSVLLATFASFPDGSYGSIALMMAIFVVVLHLLSTAVGSHLRAEADKQTAVFRPLDCSGLDPRCSMQTPSPLHTHGLALRWLPLLIVAGAVLGGCVGAVLLEATIGGRTTAVGVAIGALSAAVLGGWFAFLGGSFTAILRQGWREAVAQQKIDEARHF
jgi:hypothetical protein